MLSGSASAQSIERQIMPGPVIEGHASIENECSNCHKPFQKIEQRQQCLACHKDVASDIAAKTGFHGRVREIRDVPCKNCHSEHKGRQADVILLDEETFDHRLTDFELHGAHATAPCSSCHRPKRKHRQTASGCVDCHRDNSPHKGRLGDACTDCHNERSWSDTRFDHSAHTKFVLAGKHRDVACRSCHLGESYKKTPTACVECHRLNDVHAGRFGTECVTCHNPGGWKEARFDHDRQTRFRLTGGHRSVTCEACHTAPLTSQKTRTSCIDCHRSDDIHEGRNGIDCKSCHDTGSWKSVRFVHDRDTRFPLRGGHIELVCQSCHKRNVHKQKPQTSCISCHRPDDVHDGSLGDRCDSCHDERKWGAHIRFDHDLTRFPLIGQHAVVPCEECHTSQSFKGTKRDCIGCHRTADVHETRLGTACATCHNPNGWALWRFDHNSRTRFTLNGKHQGLQCEACHTKTGVESLKVSALCGDCHRRDDVHRGAYGDDCRSCHTTASFRELRIGR